MGRLGFVQAMTVPFPFTHFLTPNLDFIRIYLFRNVAKLQLTSGFVLAKIFCKYCVKLRWQQQYFVLPT